MSDKPKLNRFEPPTDNPVTEPYWAATREKKFLIQRCTQTEKYQFFPRAASIHAFGVPVEWVEATGRGTVYAVSVIHRPANPMMADKVPYAVALIDLEEGVRVVSNVVGCSPESVTIGQKVKLIWEVLSDGRHLPLFEPA